MRALTDRQAQMLTVIREHLATHGRPPTWREIGRAMGIRSTNGVRDHLHAMERKGVLVVDAGASRGIRVLASEAPEMPPADIVADALAEVRAWRPTTGAVLADVIAALAARTGAPQS